MSAGSSSSSSRVWTKEENKFFEVALVLYPEGTPNRWHAIASRVPGKSPKEVFDHYQLLVEDLEAIDAGRVELPEYKDDVSDEEFKMDEDEQICYKHRDERRRGIPWTEDEHKLFLQGLEQFGKGDWRSIARFVVKSKTSTQVASHAQKYFARQAATSSGKISKRSSIFDPAESS